MTPTELSLMRHLWKYRSLSGATVESLAARFRVTAAAVRWVVAEPPTQLEEMRASMREMVGRMADKGIVERAYRAMREPKPPMRKLKGKVPRYQREMIERGELEG